MSESNALDKTNRINLLFDFYSPLLTEKQRAFMTYYFHEDFSLGEIASEFGISRQAVYEHVKRAGLMLEEYETKLQLLARHERREGLLKQLSDMAGECSCSSSDRMRTIISDLLLRE